MKSVAVALFIYLHATQFGLVFPEGSVRQTADKPYRVCPKNIRPERDAAHGLTELVTDLSQTPGWKYLNKESCGFGRTTNEIRKRSNKGNYTTDFSERIVGGMKARTGEFPWMAHLVYQTDSRIDSCGGALISKRHVLTAAHCAIGDQIRVKVGSGEYIQTMPVMRIINHGDFVDKFGEGTQNDIALLVLETDVALNDFVTPVCLPLGDDRYKTFGGETGIVAGWGKTDSSERSDLLLAVAVPILENNDCMEAEANRNLKPYQLCAGEKGKDSCAGDSGGPLVTMDKSSKRYSVVGVVAYGFGCGQTGAPGVYTRVTYFLSWILNNMN